MRDLIRLSGLVGLVAALLGTTASRASAGIIYASGQLLIENEPGAHDDLRENRIYRIDTATGLAVPASPATSGLPAAVAGAPDGRLLGFSGGRLQEIDPSTGVVTPAGSVTGLNSTGFEVTPGGLGFLAPFNADFETQQLYRIDLTTSGVTPLGSPTAIGDAIDAAFGLEAGSSEPFLIGLGSVGSSIYGVNLESGRTNLIAINETTGVASVVGARDAVGGAFGGLYSGFAAMTGVDEDGDGRYDALFGGVNFFDHDADPTTSVQRLGGVARYDLGDGTFSLVGTNPGVIFFGFGSPPVPVPEPGGLTLLTSGLLGAAGLRLLRTLRKGPASWTVSRTTSPANRHWSGGPSLGRGSRPVVRAVAVVGCLLWAAPQTADAGPYTYTTVDLVGAAGTTLYKGNDAGTVVGFVRNADDTRDLGLISIGGVLSTFEVPFAGAVGTRAFDVNNLGHVAGYYTDASGFQRGFTLVDGVFTPFEAPGAVGGPDAFTNGTSVTGINDAGRITGDYTDAAGTTRSFVADDFGRGTFAAFGVPGAAITGAGGINNLGQVAGGFFGPGDASGSYIRASDGSLTILVVPGAREFYVDDINDAGKSVAFASYTDDTLGSLLRDADGTLSPIHVPGSVFTVAWGIDNRDRVTGYYRGADGRRHGFIATPVPEPDSPALLGVGLVASGAALLRRRRARR